MTRSRSEILRCNDLGPLEWRFRFHLLPDFEHRIDSDIVGFDGEVEKHRQVPEHVQLCDCTGIYVEFVHEPLDLIRSDVLNERFGTDEVPELV